MPIIRFDDVSKRYRLGQSRLSVPSLISEWLAGPRRRRGPSDELEALRHVTFEVERGDSIALVGANGAGKTTVLKLLAQITRPTSGTVMVQGRLAALIELGAGFHGDLTGRDNVFLNGAILGLSRGELRRRFDEIVAFAGLERFIDTPVKRYSSGMIVRLGFAIAASIEPDVLLVDEVLAVGDAAFSQKCLSRIRALREAGTTLVFVSHNPYLVKASCRSALYLQEGRVMLAGSAEDVIKAYDHDTSARLERRELITSEGKTDGPIAITSVDLVIGGRVNPDLPVPNDAPAEVHIRYAASVDVTRIQVGLFIRRGDGLICCTARSHLAGAELAVARGTGVISARLARLQVIGGAYTIEAYLLDAADVVVLTPAGARSPWFTVAGHGIASTNDAGVFEPVVSWAQSHHEPIPAAAVAS